MLYHFFFYKILVFMHRKNGKNKQIKKVYKLLFWEKVVAKRLIAILKSIDYIHNGIVHNGD